MYLINSNGRIVGWDLLGGRVCGVSWFLHDGCKREPFYFYFSGRANLFI